MKTRLILASMLTFVATTIAFALTGGANFDSLKDDDRKAMQERFAKELWPLMQRGEKNGCVGCHALPKTGGQMKMTGNLEKDFRMLVKDGFFIPNDSGSIMSHVTSKDRKKRMPPPGKGDPWTEEEVTMLKSFVADLDKKQQKKAK
jgi:hypothetical protein